ncbi:sigma-70 family RNA polymerase sigma factor [Caulobacter sp.]|uniref:RNA polymerase sigma factor n=1 Tax=Caulobacter sp. TaxID=78 RepID=UPI001B096FE7|nr:sigma-70 family RNA polymerase sigma factor [Caulobacter sp.]MBO9545446.1 sigma-70 family RNA polymerase sigma factor [Caulobacter sp.]
MIVTAAKQDTSVKDSGDPLFSAFVALEPALRRFVASRTRQDADVDDILQAVAARIVARDRDVPVENKTAFLFSIASNLLKDRGRRGLARRQGEHVPLDGVELADPAALQDDVLDGRQRMRRFLAALDALPGKEREVFVLHRMEGRTLLQVGEQTGLSMFQVRKLVERAMTRLARKVWKD